MQCPICLVKYNAADRAPQDVCTNKHTCCRKCVNILLDGDGRCPQCRQRIQRHLVSVNRTAVAIIQEISQEQVSDNKISTPIDPAIVDPSVEILTIEYFYAKLSGCMIIGWLNFIALWFYLTRLGSHYQLGLLYFVCFKFYQLLRNVNIIELTSKRLLIKSVLFGLLDQVADGQRLFYVQFILRWALSVVGIVMVQTYKIGQWDSCAIIALITSLVSFGELVASRKYVPIILDKVEQSQNMCMPISALVVSMLLALLTCLSSFFHMLNVWQPLIAVYFFLWLVVAIYSSVGKQKNSCFGIFISVVILLLALPYSVGMFFWMACKHGLNRWPAYIMITIRYLICPLVHLVMISYFPQAPAQNAFVSTQLLCPLQLGLALYLMTRTTA